MSTRFFLGATLLLASCVQRVPPPVPDPSAVVRPMPTAAPSTSRALPTGPSYRTSFASAARNSLVPVVYRELKALRRIAALDAEAKFVLVNARGDHLAIDFGNRLEVHTLDGAVTMQSPKASLAPVVMLDEAVVLIDEVDFEGHAVSKRNLIAAQPSDRVWAIDATATYTTYAAASQSQPYMHHGIVNGRSVEISDSTAATTTVATYGHPNWSDQFNERHFAGSGCVAVAGDRRVVVAMGNGDVFLLDAATSTTEGAPVQLAFAKLPFAARDISFVDGKVALMSSRTLHVLDSGARELWQVTANIDVALPPIDAARGRVYLVGQGIVAAAEGKIVWAHAAVGRSWATALADGIVLFASGGTFEALDRDGAVLLALHAPDGEIFVTPPAIFSDGRAAIATRAALYLVE